MLWEHQAEVVVQAGRQEGRQADRRVGSKKDTQRWLFYQLKSVRVTDGAWVSTRARARPSLTPRWHHWSWQERAHRKQRGRWGPVCLSYLWEARVLTPCQQTLTGWSSRKYWWETYYEMREQLLVKMSAFENGKAVTKVPRNAKILTRSVPTERLLESVNTSTL